MQPVEHKCSTTNSVCSYQVTVQYLTVNYLLPSWGVPYYSCSSENVMEASFILSACGDSLLGDPKRNIWRQCLSLTLILSSFRLKNSVFCESCKIMLPI